MAKLVELLIMAVLIFGLGVVAITQYNENTGKPDVIQCWNPLVPPRSILVDTKVEQDNAVYRSRSGFLFVPLPGDVCKVTPLSMELEKQQGEKQ